MIKLDHVVLANPEQMEFIIEGMRNPMNSWEKSDSGKCTIEGVYVCDDCDRIGDFCLGPNNRSLMQRLSNNGPVHRKYMRMIPVYARITAPLYWWKEFDTYKVGTVANSCSSMHNFKEKKFTLEDFSCEHLMGWFNHYDEREVLYLDFSPLRDNSATYSPSGILECIIIPMLNMCREEFLKTKDKKYWWQMIQLLPSSYIQTRNVILNYEVLANIYKSRKNHKLDEWCEFCQWIEELPYHELICGPDILRKKFNIPDEEPSESLKIYEVGKAAVDGIQEGLKNINQDKDSYCLSPDQIATMNKAIKDRDDFDGFLSGK